uniref:Uncharacterized protein n=1 Tax=Stomoxys calcitrans TaxID=35570 RepID=A0A1I8NWT7_STOCA
MSAKTSNQQGRRTPLSLSGSVAKGGPTNNNNRGGGGNSTNGHGGNNSKQDNKNQHNHQQKTEQQQQTNAQKQQQQTTNQKQQPQQADSKENPGKMQNNKQTQNESKIPKPQIAGHAANSDNNKQKQQQNETKKNTEKQQNGVSTPNNNQQQPALANKDKPANNASEGKANEKDKKAETLDKNNKTENEGKGKANQPEKTVEKSDDKNEGAQHAKTEEKNETPKASAKASAKTEEKKETPKVSVENNTSKNQKNDVEKMEIVEDEPKASPAKPKSPKTPKDTSKTNTPNKTPNKPADKTPTKATTTEATPTKAAEKVTPKSKPTRREVTTAIDDVEMEPLTVDQSPTKVEAQESIPASCNTVLAPSATSTPGKMVLPKRNAAAPKTDVQLAMQSSSSPEHARVFSQISGRRSIRPITDYTPSKFQSNPQFRESYRRINTELDATNTSLNVTVGSEVPNNSSFSFFGRGRKRDRTPPHHLSQSAIGELQTDMEISPPKRARLDFFSVVSSPLTLLRNRFSRASLQSSTPVKLQKKLEENEDEDIEVQNVSGVSVHEDIEKPETGKEDNAEEGDTTLGVEAEAATTSAADTTPIEGELEIADNGEKELPKKIGSQQTGSEDSDIKITVTDTAAKNKRCVVM